MSETRARIRGGRDFTAEREAALAHAVTLYEGAYPEWDVPADADKAVTATATALFQWLIGPAFIRLTIGPVVDRETGEPVPESELLHGGSAMQVRATQKFTAVVELVDARGNTIGDQPGNADDVTWSLSGDEVLSLEVSEDTRTASFDTTGPTGSTLIRAEFGDVFVTEAVDVVPGEVAFVRITTSTPVERDDVEQPEIPSDPEVPAQPEV